MKKTLLAIGVASLAFAAIASAATFSANLTVGSTGTDVVNLQNALVAGGFSIPAISSGAATPGYFGSQTKDAVMAYQTARGIPNTGFVGPLTRAALNAGPASAGTACPAGFTCTANNVVTPVCPVGFTCTANNGTTLPGATAGIMTPGVAGTLAVSLWNSPSNGTTVYKGQSYDVVAYKLQASASDMAVGSISLDFDTRLWLYAGSITLKDDTGAVVGQVSNLNSSNFSELTVGSDYRISIPITNYVVKSTQTRYITANVSFLPTSDRQSGYIGVTTAQIRSVDGTGVTDNQIVGLATNTGGVNDANCSNATACRTFDYLGSGAGSVVVTVDGSSPLAGLVQLSTGGQTTGVPLAVYDIKSQNAPSVLRAITFVVATRGTGKTPSDLFAQYNLKINDQVIGANSVSAPVAAGANSYVSTVVFTNFGSINLAADTYMPVTLQANIQSDTNNALDGTIASTSLTVSGTVGANGNNPDVEDQSYSTLGVNQGIFISSDLTFSGSSATLSNLVATLGSPITSNVASVAITTGYNVTFGFTLTAGNSTLYLSSNTNTALGTTSTGFAGNTASLPLSGATANPGNLAGDTAVTTTAGYYVIPAGSSRQFTFQGSMKDSGNGTFHTFSINAVNYGTTTTALTGGTINYNLQPLKISATF
jgi:peptidoglycan hydrolase-like protein with peptidoglycan-binding domain